ncbi:type IV secretion protein Rhs [Arthrobacter sp. zg-ZUI100]|uniref:DUF6531 domain-containing protein n=1 Tax=Arthrobacter jiangjiafuii TaxID=2817475 RepID=UPI001AEE8653|nr:DUF6531 domain-containing protein [Arthrobacter jiangjiafuii]MBP3037638.1 type IV secretion protein Rhs [Arthrobacter jiangjiafuii]
MSESEIDYVKVPMLRDDPDGRFVDSVAADMKAAFYDAVVLLDEKARARIADAFHVKEDFTGHYARIFNENALIANKDAKALSDALRDVVQYTGKMIQAAEEEDDRRRENNAWVDRMESRWEIKKDLDRIFGEEKRPNATLPAPAFPATAPKVADRDVPNQTTGTGGGSYGGGTSSARPAHLRDFAVKSRALDGDLSSLAENLQRHLDKFQSQCTWGTIEASGTVRAIRDYLEANGRDATWADHLANTFAEAGGEENITTVSNAALAAVLSAAGVSENRTALEIDPPTAYGAAPTSGYANDPVNTATGNFIEPETDLGFGGTASNLVLSRMYNSLASGLEASGVFGPGWASVLDQHLVLSDEGCRWVLADGRAVDFPRQGDGWDRAVGENYWLTREPATAPGLAELDSAQEGSDVLIVRDNQGSWWAYSLAGTWLGTGSGPGRAVSVIRESMADGTSASRNGKDNGGNIDPVTRLAHVRGRFLDIEYANGLAAVVRASDGRRAEYGYDDAGRLISITTETGTRTYRWNEQGLIDAVYSAAGVLEAENTYDESGRVTLQLTQHGRRTRFAYLPGRVTAVSDEDGTRSNSWIADAKGRLVGVLDSHDQRQSMAYDRHGNLVSCTERDGSVTVNAYDERGRKIRTVTPEGADLTYGWDEQDRITTLVTESGSVVTYEYADELSRDPSVIMDPLGGRTELVWDHGLLTRVTDPAGVTVEFDYDGFGDLVATRNAAGDAATILRDSAGRPTATVTPSGAQTRFAYNQAGLLIRREDADGALWSFEHDVAGRITASIAPDGGRTELEYAANGELSRTIDPLGRAIERVFDELGNVTAAVLPDGAAWGFTRDTLSRLTGVTDPAGHDWVREYDKIGNLTAVVDPTGVRTEAASDRRTGTATVADAFSSSTLSFDEYGRPVRVEEADGSAELVTYDAAGNPVELLDGDGGLTRLERDVSGKVTSVTSPSGAVTRYEYDLCGRPWKTINALGAVTELVYDADQRVTARILPTGETETFEYDACGRLVLRMTPGDGTARYGYDKAGRLSFSQDAWYGTRRYKYNVAGELVETVNGVGGRTRFEYDVRGRLIRITDPLGGVTTRTYTATGKVESVSDPLGRVTTATYDPAGRQVSQTDPDGNTTTWTYDAAGRERSTSHNGKLLASVDRDRQNRRVVITDFTGDDGLAVEHELGFNRRGQLTSRTRGAQGLSWSYDADGNRTGFTDTTGTITTYTRDAVGLVEAVRNPRLGEAVFTHDAAGRLTAVTAGDLVQEWAYRNGYLAEHTRIDRADPDASADITLIGRDGDGRITGLTRAGAVTRYGYDGAGQLVAAATTPLGGSDAVATALAQVSEWEYDAGGRLVRETTPSGPRTYTYDAAGQLLSITEADGSRTEYVFDGLGRRSRLIGADGSWTEYAWGETGYLQATVARTTDGAEAARHELWVDALGELASVDGCPVWWDSANLIPALAGIDTEQVVSLPGGVTGIGDAWIAPGWRAARPTDETDPWAVLGASVIPEPGAVTAPGMSGVAGGLPAGISLTGNGGLDVAGLEWLGARAYDPGARGFLSTDPLAPVLGAGWDGNPYAYAGNNPLNASDPTGLRPLTDQDLKAYDAANRGALADAGAAVGEWWGDNWEYVVAGAAVVAGVALMCTGVGGPVGVALIGAASGALISGGVSVATSKARYGEVDWAQAGKDALVGGIGGLAGGVAAGVLAKAAPMAAQAGAGMTQATQAVIRKAFDSTARGVVSAGVSGATSGAADYRLNTEGDRTAWGYVKAAGIGFATNAGFGFAGGKLADAATSRLPVPPMSPLVTSPWAPVVEDVAGRAVGVAQAVVEVTLDAGGDPTRAELVPAIIGGALDGSGGPVVQRHSASN